MAAQSLSGPSSSQPNWNHNVFLSTGKDTRKKFTDYLDTALIKAGINTFIDDEVDDEELAGINTFIDDEELTRCNEITSPKLKAIEESWSAWISIVVFSKGYASSTWCLDQLVKIVECKKSQAVIPIYYHVDPSDVRNQISTFANAFTRHEKRFKANRVQKWRMRMQNWRKALAKAGNLFGFDFANGFEPELIMQIVKEISKKVKLPLEQFEDVGTIVQAQSLPGPPSSQPFWNYDVILNYRGSDTRMNFTNHLYTALKKARIYTFIDDEGLERGMEIFSKLLKAIELSRISIVVFSKGYASSTWCLDELVKILECRNSKGQTVIPIFYDVRPSVVQCQTSSFAKAFDQHEKWVDAERVQKWRATLHEVANIPGFDVANRFVKPLIDEIVEKISKKPLLGLVDGHRIGELFVSNKEIAEGSNGTIVYEGTYEGRPVAVKHLVQNYNGVATREIEILKESDGHPNIVRYYRMEEDLNYVYLALELCTCNLNDLIQIYSDCSQSPVFSKNQDTIYMTKYEERLKSIKDSIPNLNLWKANDHPSPQLLKVMRDVVSGLEHLHGLERFHMKFKPQNVLIIKDIKENKEIKEISLRVKLSGDFATGCAADLISLGRVLFFCITGGRHPFGDIKIVTQILESGSIQNFEAVDLISCLFYPRSDLRPKASEVLHHPLFWSSETRLLFLRETSDLLEDRKSNSDLLKELESTAFKSVVLDAKWNEKMEPAFISHIRSDSYNYKNYKFHSIKDLLRLMRNKFNHYGQLPEDIQELLGSLPEEFDGYFASRFPKLLIEVYKVVSRYCRKVNIFQKYRLSEVFQKQC